MTDDTLYINLRRWWDVEPEYTLEMPAAPEGYRDLWRACFWNVIEAIGRRDWTFRLEEDSMWIANVSGDDGYMATPHKGASTSGPDEAGMLEALLEAYLGALAERRVG
ncbi:hypothetical protein [Deinococcus sp. 6GRE01]|uniref:hypothetical protein n=1 Tax=Deinococcus sp. 6GRE01 TaxID=2745873 RepID=UPI001E5AB637|nr:hypothetical protein [Deinococcus sp. 6GRE01]MCD0155967.1 hypothetical protein [Deinococcus sp. 6GRE01]